jgi:Na+-translocating ferredoxin:NAD+ oxidoreductase subunit B
MSDSAMQAAEASDVYERLRIKLDEQGFGFPESMVGEGEERPELAFLKDLFSPRDAEIFVAMGNGYQTAEEFAAQTGMHVDEAAATLYDMSKRSLLYRRGGENGLEYRVIPAVHGLLEFNVGRLAPSWFVPFTEYLGKSMFMPAVTGTDTPFIRSVPARREYVEGGALLPQDDMTAALADVEDFAVTECICRKAQGLAGVDVGHPLNTCLYTGEWARYAVENDFANEITREEALDIIASGDEGGRIVEALNSEHPEVICSCDSGACLVLVQHRLMIPGGSADLKTNYYCVNDAAACTQCGTCVNRCPVEAIAIDESTGGVVVDVARCLGCGLCVGTCPSKAMILHVKEHPYAPAGQAFDTYDKQAAFRGHGQA